MKGLQRFTQIEMKEHDHGEDFFKCKLHGLFKVNMQWIEKIKKVTTHKV
jgi:hypothetical protein